MLKIKIKGVKVDPLYLRTEFLPCLRILIDPKAARRASTMVNGEFREDREMAAAVTPGDGDANTNGAAPPPPTQDNPNWTQGGRQGPPNMGGTPNNTEGYFKLVDKNTLNDSMHKHMHTHSMAKGQTHSKPRHIQYRKTFKVHKHSKPRHIQCRNTFIIQTHSMLKHTFNILH